MECGRKEERPLEEDAEQERRGWRSMAKAADVAAAMRLQEAMACVCVWGNPKKGRRSWKKHCSMQFSSLHNEKCVLGLLHVVQ